VLTIWTDLDSELEYLFHMVVFIGNEYN
jgi:hypothetical protein